MSYFELSDKQVDIREKIDNATDIDKLKALAYKQLDIMIKMEELMELKQQQLSLTDMKSDGAEKIARGLIEVLDRLGETILSTVDGINVRKVTTAAREALDF